MKRIKPLMKYFFGLILVVILVGCTKQEKLEITYVVDGEIVHHQDVEKNQSFVIDKSIEKPGYELSSWYEDESLTVRFEFKEITKDTTVYAKWSIVSYQITYHLDQGNNHPDNQETYTILESITFLDASKEGYDFDGWYQDAAFNEAYHMISVGTFGHLELYAKFTKKSIVESPLRQLNELLGFEIEKEFPAFDLTNIVVGDVSDETYEDYYIEILNWTEEDELAYMDELDLVASYDDSEQSWIIRTYFVYVFEDTEAYPGKTIYGIGIYKEKGTDPVEPSPFDEINGLLGFNLEDVLPVFDTTSIDIKNESSTELEAYFINVLNWTESSINEYRGQLDLKFTYNEIKEAWEANGYYLDLYGDEESTPGTIIYGIKIFKEVTPVEPGQLIELGRSKSLNEVEKETFSKSGLPSTGTFDVLVIPVEIKGYPFEDGYENKINTVFNGSTIETGFESVASYYLKSSFGVLNLSFDIAQKYTTTNDETFYQGYGDGGDQYAILEAIQALNSSIDYSKYDSNSDGYIDSIIFIYSIEYNYDQDPWWAWVFTAEYGEAKNQTLDGKAFSYYMWASYSFMDDGIQGNSNILLNAETYIHELGHLMAYPDLYSSKQGSYSGLGGFDMMDNNNSDHGPLNKMMYGWLQPKVATKGSHQVTLESYALDQDGKDSAILIPYSSTGDLNTSIFAEYIVIIFYTPKGLYSGHIGSTGMNQAGILIYHYDARKTSRPEYFNDYFNASNYEGSSFLAKILEADYNNSLNGKNALDNSDLLTNGSLNLASHYKWKQSGAINVQIEVLSQITNNSTSVDLSITVR